MSEMFEYNKTIIKRLDPSYDGANAVLNILFKCPLCKQFFTKTLTNKININKKLDKNVFIKFPLECCNVNINLYCGLYKQAKTTNFKIIISTIPLTINWWEGLP